MRVLALFAGGFCSAVLYFMLEFPYTVLIPVCLLATTIVLVLLRRPMFLRMSLIALGAALGLLWSWNYMEYQVSWTEEYNGKVLTLPLEAISYSRSTNYGTSTVVQGNLEGHTFQAIVYGTEDLALAPGDCLEGLMKLTVTGSFWGADDLYYGAQDLDFTIQLYEHYQIYPGQSNSVRYWPLQFTKQIQQQLNRLLPQAESGYAIALLSGDRSGLSDTFDTQLSQSGTKHVVAVSGMHIGILIGALMLVFGQVNWRTSVFGLPLIWFFALAVGMTASVTRSAVMFSFALIAPLLHRENDSPTTVLSALMILLVPNPRAILDVGLQLSFASVAGILLFSTRIFQLFWSLHPLQWLAARHRWCKSVVRTVCAGISASIAVIPLTLPLCLLYFESYSMVTPLSGAMIVPLIPICFIVSLITSLVSLVFMPAAVILAYPLRLIIDCCMGLTRWVAGLPFAMVTLDNGYSLIFLAMLYGIVLILLCAPEPVRLWVPAAGIGCSFLGCILLGSLEYDRAQLSVTMLDVGQGQAIYAESKGVCALYDCGGENQTAARVVSFLQATGRFHLDILIVSHYDSDHTSGIAELLKSIPVSTIFLPVAADEAGVQADILSAAEASGTQIYWVDQDLTLTFGAAMLSIYSPVLAVEGNNGSVSAHWRCGDFDVLATGDMDADAETKLLEEHALSAIEVFVAGHHGAASSTSQLLLEQLMPELVLISVGANNSYGHPSQDTLLRLQQMGAEVYRTDQCGNITIRR